MQWIIKNKYLIQASGPVLIIFVVGLSSVLFFNDKPYIAAASAYTLLSQLFIKRIEELYSNKTKGLKGADLVQHRNKMKGEFEPKFWERVKEEISPQVIIRDIERIDQYPEIDSSESDKISAWYKSEWAGNYHRGIQLLLRVEYLKLKDEQYYTASFKDDEKSKFFLIGEIAYDSIESVDWEGDEYDGIPHFYCFFDKSGEPYESLDYCARVEDSHGHYYKKVIPMKDVVHSH